MQELGGVEYRTLNNLLWITPLVSSTFCSGFVGADLSVVSPLHHRCLGCRHHAIHGFSKMEGCLPTSLAASCHFPCLVRQWMRFEPVSWLTRFRFSVFQIIGAWTNSGMSLVDQGMQPFGTAYLLIVVIIVCVFTGSTAFVSGSCVASSIRS